MNAKKRKVRNVNESVKKEKKTRKVIAHVARSWEEAEKWDIEYWQKFSPQKRISAVESLRREWEAIKNARK